MIASAILFPTFPNSFLWPCDSVLSSKIRGVCQGSFWESFLSWLKEQTELVLFLPLWTRRSYLERWHPSNNYEGTNIWERPPERWHSDTTPLNLCQQPTTSRPHVLKASPHNFRVSVLLLKPFLTSRGILWQPRPQLKQPWLNLLLPMTTNEIIQFLVQSLLICAFHINKYYSFSVLLLKNRIRKHLSVRSFWRHHIISHFILKTTNCN